MKEVINGDELVEGTGIQTAADLNVISSQQPHGRPVLLLKHLPLQGRAEQQEVVICKEQEKKMVKIWHQLSASRLIVVSLVHGEEILTEYEGRIGSLGKVRQVKPLNYIGGEWLSCSSPGIVCPRHTEWALYAFHSYTIHWKWLECRIFFDTQNVHTNTEGGRDAYTQHILQHHQPWGEAAVFRPHLPDGFPPPPWQDSH